MASFSNMVVQVYKPTVVDSVDNFLRAWDRLSAADKILVLQSLEGVTSPNVTLKVTCETEDQAHGLVKVVNATQHAIATVSVQSESDYWVKYKVGFDRVDWKPVSCTCPDFEHRSASNPSHVCKHMTKVLRAPSSYGIYK